MAVTLLCVMALVFVGTLMCRLLGLWPPIVAWLLSNKEEKASLTRLKGHYNANGYLVPSDSDIQLDLAGSFRHFDLVDKDFPPQPLRPAPVGPILCATSLTSPTAPVDSSNITSVSAASATAQDAPKAIQGVTNVVVEDQAQVDQVPLPPNVLQRAVSCDSVCSDTSVGIEDLQEPNITGYLCVGLQYDSDAADLTISVLEAKELICSDIRHPVGQSPDTYVRVYLQPDKVTNMQTRVYKKSYCPSYKEKFLVGVESTEWLQKVISFHVYSTDKVSSTLLGEVELRLADVSPRQPVTTWLTLTDTGEKETELGEVLFSLSYLPTAERLTVVMVKARNLSLLYQQPSDTFVKVYLLQHGKKVHKKKTCVKRGERSPIFNEAIIFSVPAHTLQTIHLRVTVTEVLHGSAQSRDIGHVIIGSQSGGKALNHWTQMLTALRKPIAMWHPIRTK